MSMLASARAPSTSAATAVGLERDGTLQLAPPAERDTIAQCERANEDQSPDVNMNVHEPKGWAGPVLSPKPRLNLSVVGLFERFVYSLEIPRKYVETPLSQGCLLWRLLHDSKTNFKLSHVRKISILKDYPLAHTQDTYNAGSHRLL